MSSTGRQDHRKPATRTPTFVSRASARCPACEEAGRLDSLGFPRSLEARPLRSPSAPIGRPLKSSYGCETCGGRGRIAYAGSVRPGCKSNDPMELPEKG